MTGSSRLSRYCLALALCAAVEPATATVDSPAQGAAPLSPAP